MTSRVKDLIAQIDQLSGLERSTLEAYILSRSPAAGLQSSPLYTDKEREKAIEALLNLAGRFASRACEFGIGLANYADQLRSRTPKKRHDERDKEIVRRRDDLGQTFGRIARDIGIDRKTAERAYHRRKSNTASAVDQFLAPTEITEAVAGLNAALSVLADAAKRIGLCRSGIELDDGVKIRAIEGD